MIAYSPESSAELEGLDTTGRTEEVPFVFFSRHYTRMPPTSTNIFQEGAQIKSFKIVSEGQFNQTELKKYLIEEPAKYEGCSGTRCFGDVESDLKAQIAANNKG